MGIKVEMIGNEKKKTPYMGINVADQAALAACTQGNINPHGDHHRETYDNGGFMESCPPAVKEGETAITFAARQRTQPPSAWVSSMLPLNNTTLLIETPNLDSVGAAAVILLICSGQNIYPCHERIKQVAEATLADGELPAELEEIAATVAKKITPLAERINLMQRWLFNERLPK